MARVVILLGAPGAGKGTQAARLSQSLGLPHVATGDLFRANIGQGTELGKQAQEYMNAGKLVPDDLVIDMLFDRVAQPDCADGYLLDGFPRTVAQAETLATRLGDGANVQVINLEVDENLIVDRAAGRLLCRNCGNIHHAKTAPPKVEGVCDACGGELYRRDDDKPETVRQRLVEYNKLTAPVVEFYRKRGDLQSVNGNASPDEVFQSLTQLMGAEA